MLLIEQRDPNEPPADAFKEVGDEVWWTDRFGVRVCSRLVSNTNKVRTIVQMYMLGDLLTSK